MELESSEEAMDIDINAVIESVNKTDISSKPEYFIGEKLGEGAYGSVYIASRKTSPNKKVALKIQSYHRDSYMREKAVIDRLMEGKRYPLTLLKFYGISMGPRGGTLSTFIEMEYFKGKDLDDLYKKIQSGISTKISDNTLVTYTLSIAGALRYLQGLNISHRDIKPANIMYREDEYGARVVLVDFNLSCIHETNSDAWCKGYVGSPLFCSPEVLINQRNIDWYKSDIYSLAITFAIIAINYVEDKVYDTQGVLDIKTKVTKIFRDDESIDHLLRFQLLQCLEYYPHGRYTYDFLIDNLTDLL